MYSHKLLQIGLVLGFCIVNSQAFAQERTGAPAPAQIDRPPSLVSKYQGYTPTPAEDAIITKSIQKHIANSLILSKLNINVNTEKGVVKLKGNLDSDSQASVLVELAESIVGVKDVDTRDLTVKGSQHPLNDTLITAKVRGLFIREKVFGGKDIAAINLNVETKNGVVYLTGTIDNKEQIKNAIKIVEGVKGVKKVEYKVKKITTFSKQPTSTTHSTDQHSSKTSSY